MCYLRFLHLYFLCMSLLVVHLSPENVKDYSQAEGSAYRGNTRRYWIWSKSSTHEQRKYIKNYTHSIILLAACMTRQIKVDTRNSRNIWKCFPMLVTMKVDIFMSIPHRTKNINHDGYIDSFFTFHEYNDMIIYCFCLWHKHGEVFCRHIFHNRNKYL